MNWHSIPLKQIIKKLETSENQGLTQEEAEKRLVEYGENKLKETQKTKWWQMLLSQFTSFLIILLIVAAIISAFLGEIIDATAIMFVVILNSLFGFIQEYQAGKAIEALKKLVSPKARVIRNSTEQIIDSNKLVPGDVIILNEGDSIPADAILIESIELRAVESSLTGESLPVSKKPCVLPEKTSLGDKVNTVFFGTTIASGRGKAIIVSTGMNTEVGNVAGLVQSVENEQTPLQKRLDSMSKKLGLIAITASIVILIVGILRGFAFEEIFLISVSLAVAAIPEGLPAVVTIALAIGTQKMAVKKAIIRKLAAVETLGSANVICTDKTGTLTRNEMTCVQARIDEKEITITGTGYATQGRFLIGKKEYAGSTLDALLECACLCNNSELAKTPEGTTILGDPTEASLLVMAEKKEFNYKELRKTQEFVNEIPFTSERKMMSVIRLKNKKPVMYSKGATEVLLQNCSRILINGKEKTLTNKIKEEIENENNEMASKALRVLAFAFNQASGKQAVEKDLTFIGLVGMIDPPREEAKEAIEKCKKAGIRVIMITGDNKNTAIAVGAQLGLGMEKNALSGQEINELSEIEFEHAINNTNIFARVSPEHKLRIVTALKKHGQIVAMTGDGVNDAPAIKKADIGVGMGITGTDVTKEISDMIITDDNFASIVNAIEQGRIIYDNITKSVTYLVSCNIGEILTLFIGIVIGLPTPLIAIQILWMNLVTDGLPALALGFEPGDAGIMHRKPRDPNLGIINAKSLKKMCLMGCLMAAGTLVLFNYYLPEVEKAQTVAFSTIVLFQLFFALESRSSNSILEKGIHSNKIMLIAILTALAAQVILVQTSIVQEVFKTLPLALNDWLLMLVVSSLSLLIPETIKYVKGNDKKPSPN
ncbi:MAG: calcium-translocating P-type ATPase, PMCA-type [Candidatus Micrarchaeota archaeon]